MLIKIVMHCWPKFRCDLTNDFSFFSHSPTFMNERFDWIRKTRSIENINTKNVVYAFICFNQNSWNIINITFSRSVLFHSVFWYLHFWTISATLSAFIFDYDWISYWRWNQLFQWGWQKYKKKYENAQNE